LDADEACDGGAGNSDTLADACRSDCHLPTCGDGAVDTGEECDEGAGNSDSLADACRSDCRLPTCGDGAVDTGEQCDEGASNDDTLPDACRTDCRAPSCGDGVVDTGEECDDGNTVDTDGCTATCLGFALTIGPFTAEYYSVDTLVYTEQVQRPALQYSWSDFHSIVSESFRGVWTGTIEVLPSTGATVEDSFDLSWAEVSLSIDGGPVTTYTDPTSVPFDLAQGVHDVVVEYVNHYMSVSFNTAFTANQRLDNATATELLAPIVATDPVIVYLGAYEAGGLYNDIDVNLVASSRPILLFMSSYSALNWNLHNPNGLEVLGVGYASYGPRPTVTPDEPVRRFELESLRYGYNDVDIVDPIADITALTGRAPDVTLASYHPTSVDVDVP
jgi:cysteine-rich repeat protein